MSRLIKISVSIPVECNEKLEAWADEISAKRGFNYPKKAIAADLLVDAIRRASNPRVTEGGEQAEVDLISTSLPPSVGRQPSRHSVAQKKRDSDFALA